VSNSRMSKRQTNMSKSKYLRGKVFDDTQREFEHGKLHAAWISERVTKRAGQIFLLIHCFNKTFKEKEELVHLINEKVFQTWGGRQRFNKELNPAMRQIINCMKENGYQDDVERWIKVVEQQLHYCYKD